MPTTRTIQIRIGQKTSEKLKKWADNQTNLNDSVKRVLDHFIDIYGPSDIDTLEVKLKMAKDLVAAQGKTEKGNAKCSAPDDLNLNWKYEFKPKPEPKEKKIINRGTIDI